MEAESLSESGEVMTKKWILIHVISGIAEKVELFDSLKEARVSAERNSRQSNLENNDFSVFSIDNRESKYLIQKISHVNSE
jgi:hypothetical protein